MKQLNKSGWHSLHIKVIQLDNKIIIFVPLTSCILSGDSYVSRNKIIFILIIELMKNQEIN